MAALTNIRPTLLDLQKGLDPNGKVASVIEILRQDNEILDDMVWLEANGVDKHVTTIRTGLPEPTWRKLNQGVQPGKGRKARIADTIGSLEAYAEVDKALVEMNGNTAAFRASEDAAYIQGMNHELAASLFYANEALAPEEITGFAPRYNTRSGVEFSENIILENGVQPDGTDNTSIWLVGWGPNACHGIYAKGTEAGLQITDKGQVTIENVDGNGGRMEAYRTHYKWNVGLTVRDWRYVVRIQINSEDLTKAAASGADLIDLMTQASETVPSGGGATYVWYMNKRVKAFLRRQIMNKTVNSTLTTDMVAGKPVTYFDGKPIRRCDAILNNEAGIVAS